LIPDSCVFALGSWFLVLGSRSENLLFV